MSDATIMLVELFDTFGAEPPSLAENLLRREWDELDEALNTRATCSQRGLLIEPRMEEAIAREMADVVYTIHGLALSLGIDLDLALWNVHASNMAKLPDCPNPDCQQGYVKDRRASHGIFEALLDCPDCKGTGKGKPLKDEIGKVLKPADWVPPDMSEAIR